MAKRGPKAKAKREMIGDDLGLGPERPPRSPEDEANDAALEALLEPRLGASATRLIVAFTIAIEALGRSDQARKIGERWIENCDAYDEAVRPTISLALDYMHPAGPQRTAMLMEHDRRAREQGIKRTVDELTGLEMNWTNLGEIASQHAIHKHANMIIRTFPKSKAARMLLGDKSRPDPLTSYG